METESAEHYAPKPPAPAPQDPWVRSIISILLFAALYFMTFSHDPFYIVVLVAVLLLHEMGHFLMMKQFGYQDMRMFFIPFFGAFVSGSKQEVSQRERSIILLAGPVPGVLLGAGLVTFSYYSGYDPQMLYVASILIWLNAFNLIPISPLDGGRLIENLFFSANRIIQIIFVALSACGFLVLAYYLNSVILVLLPVLLFSGLRRAYKMEQLHKRLDELHVDYRKSYEELSDREYTLIAREYIAVFDSGPRSLLDPSQLPRLIAGVKSVLKERTIFDLGVFGKLSFTFIWILSIVLSIAMILLMAHMRHEYYLQHQLDVNSLLRN